MSLSRPENELFQELFAGPEPVHRGNRRSIPVTEVQVRQARELIRASGVVGLVSSFEVEDGHEPSKGGRPPAVNSEQVLTLMMILANEQQPIHFTVARDIITHRATPEALAALGLALDGATEQTWYLRVRDAWDRMRAVLDPFEGEQRKRRRTKSEHAALIAARDPKRVEVRTERLFKFANSLLWATYLALPEQLRQRWNGSVCLDATFIPTCSIGTPKDSAWMSPEADAGWYSHDHRYTGEPRNIPRWGLDAALAVMVPSGPEDAPFPHLVIGLSIDVPAVKPTQNAWRALSNCLTHPVPRGYIIGDGIYYPMPKAEAWQEPLRKLGYRIIGKLPRDRRGITESWAGFIQVDGAWYCPAMPQALIAPTGPAPTDTDDDRPLEKLSSTEKKRIQRRLLYLARPKEAAGPSGAQKHRCPAQGPSPTARCPLRPESMRATVEGRTTIQPTEVPNHPPKCCTNAASTTIPLQAGSKYAQQGPPYQTDEWQLIYTPARQIIEAKNSKLKSGAEGGMGDRLRRMGRGHTNQVLMVSLVIAAENLRTIQQMLTSQLPDTQASGGRPSIASIYQLPNNPRHEARTA